MLFLKKIFSGSLRVAGPGVLRKLHNESTNLKVGDSISVCKQITNEDIEAFSKVSGDTNPIHIEGGSQKAIVHGAFLNGLVSGVIGTKLPGPGTLVISQSLNFPNKCYGGELVKITVKILENRKIIKVEFICEVEEQKKIVLYGDAKLIMKK